MQAQKVQEMLHLMLINCLAVMEIIALVSGKFETISRVNCNSAQNFFVLYLGTTLWLHFYNAALI